MLNFEKHALIITMVIEFWISGLFVLSVIFTQSQQIQDLTLCTFIAYAIGSFAAGILSDIYGRKPILHVSSIVLTLSAGLLWVYPFYGYILANLAIGPLNNLTFVLINEVHPKKAQTYTILVLIGWAFSEITLGAFFLLFNQRIFVYVLFAVTVIYMIMALLYVKQTDQFTKDKLQKVNNLNNQNYYQGHISYSQTYNKQSFVINKQRKSSFSLKSIFPTTIKPLIGGSILMFMMQMFYYRTQFTLDNFGVSLQINTIVVGCTEIFANVLFTKILQSIKRRLALRIVILSLMVLLLLLIFSTQSWMQTVIEGFMRLVDTAIMIILGVYIPELFPSHEKGRGTNFIMSFGVIGSALNGKLFSHLPFWSLQLFLLAALATTLLLKETQLKNKMKENFTKSIKNDSLNDNLIGEKYQQSCQTDNS